MDARINKMMIFLNEYIYIYIYIFFFLFLWKFGGSARLYICHTYIFGSIK